jgi:hypothetical protein
VLGADKSIVASRVDLLRILDGENNVSGAGEILGNIGEIP